MDRGSKNRGHLPRIAIHDHFVVGVLLLVLEVLSKFAHPLTRDSNASIASIAISWQLLLRVE